MPSFININGRLQPGNEAAVMADDRAFRYGYGLFETMLVVRDNVRFEAFHWERLLKGMALLAIESPPDFADELRRELRRTLAINNHEDLCRARVQVSAGRGGIQDMNFRASYLIETSSLEASIFELNKEGLALGLADAQKHTGPYANLKICNALPLVLAARQARERGWNDALLKNEYGNLVESTIANLFWMSGKTVGTPPLAEGCISGVMRAYLLKTLPDMGYEVFEAPCSPITLQDAEAVFLSNSVRGMTWVKSFRNLSFEAGPVSDLHAVLRKCLESS